MHLHKCIGNHWPLWSGGISIQVATKTGHGFHSIPSNFDK